MSGLAFAYVVSWSDSLSKMQRLVLELHALGYETREIAGGLEISEKTVNFHCALIMRKMGVNSMRRAVILWWLEHGTEKMRSQEISGEV